MTGDFTDPTVGSQLAALNAALAEAQGEFPAIEKNRTAEVRMKSGGSYSYKYADLADILKAVLPVLSKHGLSLTQPLKMIDGSFYLVTELRHKDGGVSRSDAPIKAMEQFETPQLFGSTHSYLRRYAATSILGIATEEDDDGQAAAKDSGAEGSAAGAASPSAPEMITQPQHAKIAVLINELEEKAPPAEGQLPWVDQLRSEFGIQSRTELTKEQAGKAIEWLEGAMRDAEIPF